MEEDAKDAIIFAFTIGIPTWIIVYFVLSDLKWLHLL